MLTIGNSHSSEISLYFHIPFCTRKCEYCHFYVLPDHEALKQQLLEGFKLEWKRILPLLYNKKLATIYFGGGTPSLFGPARISQLLQLIQSSLTFQPTTIEITLEVNPENVSLSLMREYAQIGINRVSLGVQTLDSDLLQLLGRLHQPTKAMQAVEETYQAGITNISIDLMYDLPRQTLKHWETTLRSVQTLPLTHLSLYNLTIEPHTLFFKKQKQLTPLIPDEETSLAMYEMAIEKLAEQGLQQYEISAFAKPGFYSKHNTGYWLARPFLGLGPSAFSYWEGKRFRNIAHLNKYCSALHDLKSPIDFEEQLDPVAQRLELLVIQLRLSCGIDLNEFEKRHGLLDAKTKATLEQLQKQGFLHYPLDRLQLTKRGMLFYDTIAIELI